MKNHVNLMSEGARFRVAARRRMKRWSLGLAGLVVVLSTLASRQWLQYRDVSGAYDALEARYEPIRQLNAANRALRTEATALVTRDKTPLELSRRVPAEGLLELVGRAVKSCGGKAFISRLTLSPDNVEEHARMGSGVLSLEAVSHVDGDVEPMLAVLKQAPFTEVKVVSSEVVARDGRDQKIVAIECHY